MRIIRSVAAMQRQALNWRRTGRRIGLVPTMGYLHAGHIALVRQARQAVGPRGYVVVSIFVNPTQFGLGEDFTKYPRDLRHDKRLCCEAGVNFVFAPRDRDMYSSVETSPFSTYVVEERLSGGMEGVSRPTHFRGVTTIVAKLFNLVLPEVAVFGAKDFQQGAVIRKMVRDLNFPIRIIVASTVRESDGLAMSSRNKYLSPTERQQATILSRTLWIAADRVRNSRAPITAGSLKRDLIRLIERQPATRVDYVEFFDPSTLQPVQKLERGTHMALAVLVGKTRLIDNARL